MSVAQDAGALSNSALAALTLIEEHGTVRLSEMELYRCYRRADNMLRDMQDVESMTRLRTCARIVIERLSGVKLSSKDFSLPDVVRAYEAKFIEQALELEQGNLTRAANRLGIKHQVLSSLLTKRHTHLLNKRTPPVSRKRSIMPDSNKPVGNTKARKSRAITILHVESDGVVANTVENTLKSNGWRVDTCSDGITVLRKLASDAYYDLLLFDNELSGRDGLELVRTARKLPHRCHTSVIMFSVSDYETEAWKAGVDAFLRKPEDASALTSTIARLLTSKGRK